MISTARYKNLTNRWQGKKSEFVDERKLGKLFLAPETEASSYGTYEYESYGGAALRVRRQSLIAS